MYFPARGNGRQGGWRGYRGSELMQMGVEGSSRGSAAKPSVQRRRHYADIPTSGVGVAAGMKTCEEGKEC